MSRDQRVKKEIRHTTKKKKGRGKEKEGEKMRGLKANTEGTEEEREREEEKRERGGRIKQIALFRGVGVLAGEFVAVLSAAAPSLFSLPPLLSFPPYALAMLLVCPLGSGHVDSLTACCTAFRAVRVVYRLPYRVSWVLRLG